MTSIESDIEQYKILGGYLDFTFFETDEYDAAFEQKSIETHLRAQSDGAFWVEVDRSKFDELHSSIISEPKFLGDMCDPETRLLRSPWRLLATDGIKVGDGGQFALGFGDAIHFDGGDAERQRLFTRITDYIIPRAKSVIIRDWTSTDLPKLSNYFDDGIDYWGVYLFTIFQPEKKLLAVISGSATD